MKHVFLCIPIYVLFMLFGLGLNNLAYVHPMLSAVLGEGGGGLELEPRLGNLTEEALSVKKVLNYILRTTGCAQCTASFGVLAHSNVVINRKIRKPNVKASGILKIDKCSLGVNLIL